MRTGFPFPTKEMRGSSWTEEKRSSQEDGKAMGMVFLWQVSLRDLIVAKDCTPKDRVVADRKIGRLESVGVGNGSHLNFTNSENV